MELHKFALYTGQVWCRYQVWKEYISWRISCQWQ